MLNDLYFITILHSLTYNFFNYFVIAGTVDLWSNSSTQYFFNIDHPDLLELKKDYKMEEQIIPTIVPSIDSQQQTLSQNVERVTISQLF